MCLLDEVLEWDAERICCRTTTHRDDGNPLRARDRLGIVAGIEYAAQTMAIHGALSTDDEPPAMGFLAGVRAVEFHVLRLDDVEEDLLCDAVRMAGDGALAMYEFVLRTARCRLLNGRATVILNPGGRKTPKRLQ